MLKSIIMLWERVWEFKYIRCKAAKKILDDAWEWACPTEV